MGFYCCCGIKGTTEFISQRFLTSLGSCLCGDAGRDRAYQLSLWSKFKHLDKEMIDMSVEIRDKNIKYGLIWGLFLFLRFGLLTSSAKMAT